MTYNVFLPKTNFPMKANLAQKEPDILDKWESLYEVLRHKSSGRKKFILHFGPPYANGNIHIGHALNVILKDIVNKNYQMAGYDAPLVPGWDCHGLPIEWKIEEKYKAEKKSKDENIQQFRKECREFAQYWLEEQKKEFRRLGVIANFENPYNTMDFASEAAILKELYQLVDNNQIYRGLKPVMWSVIEQTALAEAEVEYKDKESDSIYVGFEIVNNPKFQDTKVLIWTTTPWTLPGNRAICYGHFNYVLAEKDGQKYLVAEDLFLSLQEKLSFSKDPMPINNKDLEGIYCKHPLYDMTVPLLYGEHVSMDAGTGFVHTAPGHGLEDFAIGKEHNLEVPELVNPDGTYTAVAGERFQGIHIFKANPVVMQELGKALLYAEKITHSYPHSWRSKAPLIFRATAQWFVKLDPEIRANSLNEIPKVEWYPKDGQNRIRSMVENRPDWCISRQRCWGTPIALFVHKDTKEILRDHNVNQRIIDAISKHGSDVWYTMDATEFLKDNYNADDYEKITDTVDVWLDSGATQSFVLKNRAELSWPADLYLEGSDQHRGWFQSSLLLSVATNQLAPYKSVLTHGFVLDAKGYKMSKSLGNTITPQEIIKKYGADVLRLWVATVDWQDDVRIGHNLLQGTQETYRRFRNTLRYLLGSLKDFEQSEIIETNDMPDLEKWILHRLAEISKVQQNLLDDFKIVEFYEKLYHFCNSDLSAFYFDVRKDILYCDHSNSIKRRAVRTTLYYVFEYLVRWLAPLLSFTAEEAWMSRGNTDSIHGKDFLAIDKSWYNPNLAKQVNDLKNQNMMKKLQDRFKKHQKAQS